MLEKLLTKRAVSDIIGVHEATVMRLVRQGKFPQPLRTGGIGSSVRFRAKDVQDWIEGRTISSRGGAQ
jgi:excisionase family DNA binding protein